MSDKSPGTPALAPARLEPHSLLPIALQRDLRAAALVEPEVPFGESNFRISCLQLAVDAARWACPKAFKPY